jgi:hypothetical protein
MNVNEYIKINFDNNTATTSSSVNTSFNSSISTSSISSNSTSSISIDDDYDDDNNDSFNNNNRHDYYKLELLKTNIDNLKLNLLLNEIKCEMNSLIDKFKFDLTIDLQTKMSQLVYEQTLLNAKFTALQCCLSNNEFNSENKMVFVIFF